MKKKIALFLSMIMVLNLFGGFPVFALEKSIDSKSSRLDFKEMSIEVKDDKGAVIQKPQGIKTVNGQLELADGPLSDEVAMKWKMGDVAGPRHGVYTLNYYIEAGDENKSKPLSLKLNFHVGEKYEAGGLKPDGNTVALELEVKDNGIPMELPYITYKTPYSDTDVSASEKKEMFTYNLSLNPNALSKDKELVVAVGSFSKIKMYIKDYEMILSTTGIKKDYITSFDLTYDSGISGLQEEGSFKAFKGISNFEVLPTHLTTEKSVTTHDKIGLPSKTTIDLDKIGADDVVSAQAGSKPGIVVSIKKPRVLKGNEFVPVDQVASGKDAQDAELYLEEILGKGADVETQKQIKLKFKLDKDADIIDTMDGQVKGKVHEYQDKYELYFVKDKAAQDLVSKENEKYIVEWPHLEAGMLINGEVAFGGKLFGENTKAVRFKPEKVGYTYVKYSIYRLTADDISFKVEPYNINGPVSYTLLKEGLLGAGWDAVDIRHYQDKPNTDQITLTTKKGAYEHYKITMSTGSNKGEFESQIVKYNGKNDVVPPPYSEILSIDNVYVVPDDFTQVDSTSNDISAVGLDIEWAAPEKEKLVDYLKSGELYYELYLSDSPKKTGKPIKVFKALLEGGNVKLKPYAGQVKGELTYDLSRGSFSAQGVVLKDKEAELNEWEILSIPDYEGKSQYPDSEAIKVKNEAEYTVPNTYYLTIRSVYEKASEQEQDLKLATSKHSNPKALSLDVVRKVVPVPEMITSKPLKDEDAKLIQSLYFNPVDLTDYVKYMLDPLDLKLHGESDSKYNRTYEIYLYQNKEVDFKDIRELSLEKDKEGNYIATLLDEDKTFLRQDDHALKIDYKADKNTLSSDNKFHELILKGLEPNTPYYVQVRVRLELGKDKVVLAQKVYSVYSKIHAFTTDTKPVPPNPDEQVPPAPADFFIEEQPNNTTVKLGWKEPEFANNQEESIYYELIRSQGQLMKEEDRSRMLDIEEILKDNKQYKGFHTADTYIKTYLSGGWTEHQPLQGSQFLRLEENTLLPNTIYYYYIRTVLKTGQEKIYSDWIMVPVTTEPVQRPTQLRVEPASAYKHDTAHEVVVSFLAPIPKGSKVPEDFSFDIAVKGEADEDYSLNYSTTLIEERNVDQRYKRFVYKIKDLEHGRHYDIKVRVVDHTAKEVSYSLYSEKVAARTEYNEEDQDKENAFKEYLEVYDREADKLRRKPYWVVESLDKEGVYKYRQSYVKAEMAAFTTYELVSKEGARSLHYYLPSDFFDQAVQGNTMVNVTLDGYSGTFRAGMLEGNEDIAKARERVKKGKAKDFYIELTFSLSSIKGTIKGNEAISPEIFIDLQVVYIDEEDLSVEDEILDELNGLIDEGREDVIDDLEKEIKDGRISDERLQRIIEDTLSWVTKKHEAEVYKFLKGAIEKKWTIYDIQKPIYLLAPLESYDVSAYYLDESWKNVYAYKVGNGFAIEVDKLGSYVFTGRKGASTLVPDIPGGSDLISKYGLLDFFNMESGLSQVTTKEKLYGAVARVMGARRGTDYINYLKNRGIKLVVPNTLYSPLRQDEAVYIVMQAYEKMYYKDVKSIYITNKLRVENIGTFKVEYRPYIYAAVELGVIVPENNKVIPGKEVTAKDVIRMLARITPK